MNFLDLKLLVTTTDLEEAEVEEIATEMIMEIEEVDQAIVEIDKEETEMVDPDNATIAVVSDTSPETAQNVILK